MTLVENPGSAPTLCLDEMLNLAAARPLAEALASLRGHDLGVSVANVRHLGAQCGQILMAGVAAWKADGHKLAIVDTSEGFAEGLTLLGLEPFFAHEESSQ